MKNHWMHLYQQRKNRFWTAEFTKSGRYVLSPRRVKVDDPNFSNHRCGIIFEDSGITQADNELVDFLQECNRGMIGMESILRHYQSIQVELESYGISGLDFDAYSLINGNLDLKVELRWKHLSVSV